MSPVPSPTWYDVLGVHRDASPAEIKAAWRTATDTFVPGSGSGGQFRMFNEAADVLLDPERRAAYDETLGAAPVDTTVVEPEHEEPGPSAPGPVPAEPEESTEAAGSRKTRRSAGRPASRTALVVTGVVRNRVCCAHWPRRLHWGSIRWIVRWPNRGPGRVRTPCCRSAMSLGAPAAIPANVSSCSPRN